MRSDTLLRYLEKTILFFFIHLSMVIARKSKLIKMIGDWIILTKINTDFLSVIRF